MSRRGKASPIPKGLSAPSPPQESNLDHRAFLIRSLDRCDTDLAALVELNRSLHNVKDQVIDTCGEATLLDMGEGLLKLSHDDSRLEGRLPKEGHESLCMDFLLRMKLRRKLLSRLSRRLNRVAHAMDGEDVSPPGPPKYGDLRLHVDANAVEIYAKHWQRQEEARRRIAQKRQSFQLPSLTDPEAMKKYVSEDDEEEEDDSDQPSSQDLPPMEGATQGPDGVPSLSASIPNETNSEHHQNILIEQEDYEILRDFTDSYEKEIIPSTGTVKYTVLDQDYEEDHSFIKYGAGIGATHRSMSSREKEAEWKRWQTALLSRIPDQPTFEELGMVNRVFLLEERRKKLAEEVDFLDDEDDDDTEQEEEGELKAKGNKDEDGDESMADVKVSKGSETKVDDDDDMDDDTDEKDTDGDDEKDDDSEDEKDDDSEDEKGEASKDEKDDDSEDEKDDDSDDGKDGNDATDMEKETKSDPKTKVDTVPPKPLKPISFSAIPSFHEQDQKRLRLIHAELMASSIHEHARRRIAEVTMDYNHAFRTSNEIYNRRVKLQTDLNSMTYDHRVKLNKLKNDLNLEAALNRARHQKRKDAWEAARRPMPPSWGQQAIGTQRTAAASAHPDPLISGVGQTLAGIVDAVVMRAETGWQDSGRFDDLQQPSIPDVSGFVVDKNTGETLGQRHERLESGLRREISSLSTQLQASEEERKRAWRKMLKTKAEFDIPHQQMTNSDGRRGRMQVDPSQFHLLPVPPLRASSVAIMPPAAGYDAPSIPSYVPPTTPSAAAVRSAYAPVSDSKYSAAKVKERISADGSVMPVTEPKKNKDGLYQRPAGRTRKGMEWDAIRGIWVPSSNPDEWN